MHRREMHNRFWLQNLRGESLEDLGMDGTIILNWTLNRARADAVVEWILVLLHIQEILGSNLSRLAILTEVSQFVSSRQCSVQLWGPTSLLPNWVPGASFPGIKWQGHEADHSSLSSTKFMNA
jgi:hypothetical protein